MRSPACAGWKPTSRSYRQCSWSAAPDRGPCERQTIPDGPDPRPGRGSQGSRADAGDLSEALASPRGRDLPGPGVPDFPRPLPESHPPHTAVYPAPRRVRNGARADRVVDRRDVRGGRSSPARVAGAATTGTGTSDPLRSTDFRAVLLYPRARDAGAGLPLRSPASEPAHPDGGSTAHARATGARPVRRGRLADRGVGRRAGPV